jgi:stage II sporulation protein AA (anti-sigma F factor antagonist)
MIKSNCKYRFTATPEGLLVGVSGEIDHHSALSMRRDVDNIIWNRTPTHLILDMSEVEFMDSSGLGFIMGRYALMREIGGNLSLRDPSPVVLKMLTMTGFDKKVRITTTSKL